MIVLQGQVPIMSYTNGQGDAGGTRQDHCLLSRARRHAPHLTQGGDPNSSIRTDAAPITVTGGTGARGCGPLLLLYTLFPSMQLLCLQRQLLSPAYQSHSKGETAALRAGLTSLSQGSSRLEVHNRTHKK